ncbi:hypothetical protein FJZ53_01585 [Candidatus Woesearchaeota archaeon]|nr:hypothetical protein [Candidatus Woesearchaeota archaeon]
MAKLVYKGKIKGNDVIYKECCINYYMNGGNKMNLMKVITETGKEFHFQCLYPYFIKECLEGNKNYLHDDEIHEVIIKEKGKPTLEYKSKKISEFTVEGRRAKIFLERATEMYNEIRREIFNELRAKPKDKKLEKLVRTDEQLQEEAADAFNTDTKDYGLRLYREDTKRFIKFFSKIDKNTKKGLLNEIFSSDYENKEAVDWLNQNEADLLREAGFNG